ncbi:uncharacterized protein YALI1_C08923g [Yarrowia lipolytica]|uniref:Uncharacterized protein n=1 Tax=Yarrowia lipolytica TaxID=4952 RepID=A0A1D8N9Y3_YARLL|nr:hypothetical protein YALI1_C08923g [Yarrowia lipolytica]
MRTVLRLFGLAATVLAGIAPIEWEGSTSATRSPKNRYDTFLLDTPPFDSTLNTSELVIPVCVTNAVLLQGHRLPARRVVGVCGPIGPAVRLRGMFQRYLPVSAARSQCNPRLHSQPRHQPRRMHDPAGRSRHLPHSRRQLPTHWRVAKPIRALDHLP